MRLVFVARTAPLPYPQFANNINTLAVFAPPAYLQLGNASRVMDHIRLPHTQFFNMAVLKDSPIREQVRIQLRAEAFGVLNHVSFSDNQNNFTLYIGGNRTIQVAAKLIY